MDQMTADSFMGAELEARRDLMKYAVIIVSTLPMMVIYPFVQKYFVKGVTDRRNQRVSSFDSRWS